MSTGLNCAFHEVLPGRWYYLLETWDSPKGGDNWRDYADAYGPFDTQDAAIEHLDRNHANPGGWMNYPHPATHAHPAEWRSNGGRWDNAANVMIPFQSCSCGLYRTEGEPWPTVAPTEFMGGADVARLVERADSERSQRRRVEAYWRY